METGCDALWKVESCNTTMRGKTSVRRDEPFIMQGGTVGGIGVSRTTDIAANGRLLIYGRATVWKSKAIRFDLLAKVMTSQKAATRIELSDLAGQWHVDRVIRHQGGLDARFYGKAQWVIGTDRAEYFENGQLQMPDGSSFHAERRYHWDADLNVFFADGRFFHAVPAGGGQTTHFCDPDTYDVTYSFQNWPCFDVKWCVKGPRKDYVSETRYTR